MDDKVKIALLANWGLGLEVLVGLANNPKCEIVGVISDVLRWKEDKWKYCVIEESERLGLNTWFREKDLALSKLDELVIDGAELIISVSFHSLIPNVILRRANCGGVNLHPSLLPQYRGASPLRWALHNGEKCVGLTYHYMNNGLDAGNIINQVRIEVFGGASYENMLWAMRMRAIRMTDDMIDMVLAGYKGIEQNEEEATYYGRFPIKE